MTSAVHVCLLVTLVMAVFVQLSTAQSSGSSDCCGTYLMDATGLVAIEAQRPLVTSSQTYQAVRVRVCTSDPVAVQIWRRVDATTFQFRWQTQITPVVSESPRTYVTINLSSAPLELTADDRLALYTPATSARLSVPFRADTTANLFYSTTRYPNADAFQANIQATADDLRWPRTFNDSVIFCLQAGCAELPPVTTAAPPISTTMARGPTSSTGPCCPTAPFSCDSTDVTTGINNQTGRVIELQNTISLITKMINDLFGSRQITGTCPQGFTPGSLGVGKCYVLFRDPVQMALAVLRCRDNFQARLLAIESVEEEIFLKSMIGNNSVGTGVESYWTSGMYSRSSSAWFWYDESRRTSTSQVYRNWDGGVIPVPAGDSDVCSTLSLDMATNRDFWQKQDCGSTKYYICEQPKTCL